MSFHLVLFWLPLSQAVHERKLLLFWLLLLLLPPSCALLVSSLCSHPVDCIVYDAAAPGAAPMLLPLLLLLLSGTASSSLSQTQLLSQSRHIVVITAICKWQRFLSPSHPLSSSLPLYASHPTAAAFKIKLIICAFSSSLFVRSV